MMQVKEIKSIFLWEYFRVPTVMKNLEKSWTLKVVVSRSGKVLEKNQIRRGFGKVLEIGFVFFVTKCCSCLFCFYSIIFQRGNRKTVHEQYILSFPHKQDCLVCGYSCRLSLDQIEIGDCKTIMMITTQ